MKNALEKILAKKTMIKKLTIDNDPLGLTKHSAILTKELVEFVKEMGSACKRLGIINEVSATSSIILKHGKADLNLVKQKFNELNQIREQKLKDRESEILEVF